MGVRTRPLFRLLISGGGGGGGLGTVCPRTGRLNGKFGRENDWRQDTDDEIRPNSTVFPPAQPESTTDVGHGGLGHRADHAIKASVRIKGK